MMKDRVESGRLQDILADEGTFKEAMDGLMGMFDREIFDRILTNNSVAGMLATALADKLHTTVLLDDGKISKGEKVVIIADSLGNGVELKSIVDFIESRGAEVIRIGCIVEKESEGARKSKILRGYPFEALVVI